MATQEVLGSVNMFHTSPPVPPASGPPHALPWNPECYCHQPRFGPLPLAYFAFALGSDTLGVAYNQAPAGAPGWLVDGGAPLAAPPRPAPQLSTTDRHWINGQLTRLARAPLPRWGYHFLVANAGDSTTAFALTRMPTSWGDTIVYAVEYSKRSIDSMIAATFDQRDLLPGAIAVVGTNREILQTEVRDVAGHVLFANDVPKRWTLDADATLPLSYGGLSIKMQVQPDLAQRILIGGLPRSRLPLLLALFALAAGLTTVAVTQLRREARFARDRSAFVASASHELRTPLAQIRLVVDMLRLDREKEPARQEASLALVDREVTRLQHLVDTVLRFARGEPESDVGREPVNVAAEARSVVEEFLPLARPRGATIVVHGGAAPVVRLRAGAVRQVLLNLLDNAVKYGPAPQAITVTVEAIGAAGARLTVSDQGTGVPESERERIWRAFERGSAANERAAGGSGIGLTVVRDIAERHGGRTWVESAPAGGARFVVEFPGEA
ncbi:MAG: HAMP domain-containing sensor histidine kinase [Gemmatimonadota bacterium]